MVENVPQRQYIYIYTCLGLAGWAGGARKVSTPEWRTGDRFAHDVRDFH